MERASSVMHGTGVRAVLHAPATSASCAVELPRSEADAQLHAELQRWLEPNAETATLDSLLLGRLITHHIRWVGVHHLDDALEAQLDAVRRRHRGGDAFLDAFLDCVLAKLDGCYWNRTYLLFPVLEQLVDEPDDLLRPQSLAALLAADIVRNELCASSREKPISPLGRPEARTLRTRLRHAMRFMSASLGTELAESLLAEVAHEPESSLPDILGHLPQAPARWTAEWIEVTVQPVSSVHDEYFFIRALQCHEMTYLLAAQRIADATAALQEGRTADASAAIDEAASLVGRGASLFRMIATLRREAFHTFRDFTEGASAIQSEQYKRFEGRCGTPPDARLGSPAFASVPSVKAEVEAGQHTLVEAWLEADQRRPDDPEVGQVAASMAVLETAHRRWKRAHVTVATRMLGDARGTGYTAGVPYLKSWMDHRLFWKAPQVAALEDARS